MKWKIYYFCGEILVFIVVLIINMSCCTLARHVYIGMGIAMYASLLALGINIHYYCRYILLKRVRKNDVIAWVHHYVWPFGCWRSWGRSTLRVGRDDYQHFAMGIEGRWEWEMCWP